MAKETQLTVQQALALGVQHHQAGRLREAEAIYRQILLAQPGNCDALHLLGILASQSGKLELAIDLLQRAVAGNRSNPQYHINLGQTLLAAGRVAEAIARYRSALSIQPDSAEAHNSLGIALRQQGQHSDAVEAFRRATQIRPDFAEAQNNLGAALAQAGQFDEAIAAYRLAIQHRPAFASAHFNLGVALRAAGDAPGALKAFRDALVHRPEDAALCNDLGNALRDLGALQDAAQAYERAILLRPGLAEAYNGLGAICHQLGRHDHAIEQFRKAAALRPTFVEAISNLAAALQATEQYDEAIELCQRALAINPAFAMAHYNLGMMLMTHRGQIDQGISEYRQALAQRPDWPEAHLELALALLLQGQFIEGWREYEWRCKVPDQAFQYNLNASPVWDGCQLDGKRILVHSEQGLGDTIQFVRFLPMVRQAGGSVTLRGEGSLIKLLRRSYGDCGICSADEPAPQSDVQCPLLSLARLFQTEPGTIPAAKQYLRADAQQSAHFRARLERFGAGLKIGLVWAGNRSHYRNRQRSIPLAALSGALPCRNGAKLVSLQKGEASEEVAEVSAKFDLIDWTSELHDFDDTAALIEALDLVISVDTAPAHLAAALGRPVWVLLPSLPDWRWMLNRADSPWYPTMRLFRQPLPGDWETPLGQIAMALDQLR